MDCQVENRISCLNWNPLSWLRDRFWKEALTNRISFKSLSGNECKLKDSQRGVGLKVWRLISKY